MMTETKFVFKSKTIIVNLLSLAAALAMMVGLEVTTAEQEAVAVGILAIANIYLRFKTDKKLTT